MSNCSEIQNANVTPDKAPYVLIYESLSFDEIQYVGARV